jgi:CelD/BcsL family acetyltransferase involved in cellulose biosynthesis
MRKVRYYKRRSLATIGLSISICKPWQVGEEFLSWTIAQRDRSLETKGRIADCPEEAQGITLVRVFRQILEMTHSSADFLVVCIARSKEGPVGGALYFRAGKELMKYLQGWLSTVEQYNVGTLMDVAMLQWAWAAGYQRVDFGRGDEPYKNSLGGKRETYLNVVYRP